MSTGTETAATVAAMQKQAAVLRQIGELHIARADALLKYAANMASGHVGSLDEEKTNFGHIMGLRLRMAALEAEERSISFQVFTLLQAGEQG